MVAFFILAGFYNLIRKNNGSISLSEINCDKVTEDSSILRAGKNTILPCYGLRSKMIAGFEPAAVKAFI
jgi:hypothetical protein